MYTIWVHVLLMLLCAAVAAPSKMHWKTTSSKQPVKTSAMEHTYAAAREPPTLPVVPVIAVDTGSSTTAASSTATANLDDARTSPADPSIDVVAADAVMNAPSKHEPEIVSTDNKVNDNNNNNKVNNEVETKKSTEAEHKLTGAPVPAAPAPPSSTAITTPTTPTPANRRGPTPVLIAVETAPQHFLARDSIRATWGAILNEAAPQYDPSIASQMDVRFFVGELKNPDEDMEKRINAEGMMVRLTGFKEDYLNLTSKTLALVCWAADNGYQHVLKVDDDVFLQLGPLNNWLKEVGLSWKGAGSVYGGEFAYGATVQNDPKSKWYMSDQYQETEYPPYAMGPCYFLGSDLVRTLSGSRGSLPLYRVEDAGVSIWLRSILQPEQIQMEVMNNMWYQANCFNTDAVFMAPVNAKEMRTLQQNKNTYGDICGSWKEPFVMEECQQHRCLCYPLPENEADCRTDMGQQEYVDSIPRLLQTAQMSSRTGHKSSKALEWISA